MNVSRSTKNFTLLIVPSFKIDDLQKVNAADKSKEKLVHVFEENEIIIIIIITSKKKNLFFSMTLRKLFKETVYSHVVQNYFFSAYTTHV